MNNKKLERWSPLILLVVTLLIWEGLCRAFSVSEFIFPSPSRIAQQTVEYSGVIAAHAWRTYWVTMAGFGLAIVVGVLLGFVIGSSRLAYAAVYPLMTAFNALPKAAFVPILVVWFGIGIGPAILTAFFDQLLPHHRQYRHGLGHLGARTRRRVARARRQALGCVGQGRFAALHALLFWFAQSGHHLGLCGHHGVRDDRCQ